MDTLRSVGPYRILRPLGAGGMGEVYLAIDTRLGRRVALKALHQGALTSEDARQRLLHEARAAAALNHPGIAGIYDILDADERAHIVMEYVEGEPLSAILKPRGLPLATAIDLGMQMADALAAAHAAGVVHRDLKPANIHVTPEGRPKILDFGIARLRPPTASSTTTTGTPSIDVGRFAGTLGYTAPEQLLGQAADPRSDVYSLGVILFEMLTGQRPFARIDAGGLALAMVTEGAPAVTHLNPAVPSWLSDLVAYALERDPARRLPSASHLRNELRRASAELAEVSTATLPVPSPRPAWLRRRRAIALAAVATAIIAASSWLLRPGDRPPAPRPVLAVLPLANLSGDPAKDYMCVGIAEALVTSLARVPAVTVVSHAATLEARARGSDSRAVARDLGVTYLIDGGVQQSGDQLRVTLNLVRGDGSVAWGNQFDSRVDELFPLQRRLAEALTDALEVRLDATVLARVARQPTANAGALADYWRGRALLERPDLPQNVDSALNHFVRAIEQDPKFAPAHAGLSDVYYRRYRHTNDPSWATRAVDAGHEALRLDPEQPLVRTSLANIYNAIGKPEAAAEELRQVIGSHPGNDEAHSILGNVLVDQGKTEEALAEYARAIEIRPNFWIHQTRRGFVYYQSGRFAEAIESFRRVTELQPDNAAGFQMLGSAYHAQGDTGEALRSYQRAIAIAPTVNAYSNIGLIHFQDSRYADAAAAYSRAVDLRPREPHHHRSLGDAYQKLGRRVDALGSYRQALDLHEMLRQVNPKDARNLASLALCQAKMGQLPAADARIREALALNRQNAEVHFRSAAIHTIAGRLEDALAEVETALRLGSSASVLRHDFDLERLRKLPRFERALADGR